MNSILNSLYLAWRKIRAAASNVKLPKVFRHTKWFVEILTPVALVWFAWSTDRVYHEMAETQRLQRADFDLQYEPVFAGNILIRSRPINDSASAARPQEEVLFENIGSQISSPQICTLHAIFIERGDTKVGFQIHDELGQSVYRSGSGVGRLYDEVHQLDPDRLSYQLALLFHAPKDQSNVPIVFRHFHLVRIAYRTRMGSTASRFFRVFEGGLSEISPADAIQLLRGIDYSVNLNPLAPDEFDPTQVAGVKRGLPVSLACGNEAA